MPDPPGLDLLDNRLLDGLAFCSAAYDVFDAIRSQPDGIAELRLRSTRRAKKLLEEILPLAAFIQSRYGPGCRIRIRWLSGNQSFDARILYQGRLIEWWGAPKRQYLEITTAVQGTEYLVREHLQATGGSFSARGTHRDRKTKKITSKPVTIEHTDGVTDFVTLICSRVADKAKGTYPPATTLLVNCDLGEVVLEDEWDEIVQSVRATLAGHQQRFQEVVVIHDANRPTIVARRRGRSRRPNKKVMQQVKHG
jgi:hypothetical protein